MKLLMRPGEEATSGKRMGQVGGGDKVQGMGQDQATFSRESSPGRSVPNPHLLRPRPRKSKIHRTESLVLYSSRKNKILLQESYLELYCVLKIGLFITSYL